MILETSDAEEPSPSLEPFETQLPVRLRKIADLFEDLARLVIVEPEGLRFTEIRILAYLSTRTEASVLKISHDLLVDKAWISRLLRPLGYKQMITRRRDPEDGRTVLVSATKAGRDAYMTIMRSLSAHDATIMRGVSQAAAQGLCDRLEANLRQARAQVGPPLRSS